MADITKVADVIASSELVTEETVKSSLGWVLGGSNDFVTSFWKCLVVILVTEIGDKTFFIAAVLAMRHGRLIGINYNYTYLVVLIYFYFIPSICWCYVGIGIDACNVSIYGICIAKYFT